MRLRTPLLASSALLAVVAVAAPAAGPAPLVVRVVARDGSPIAGAVVDVSASAPADGRVTGSWRRAPVEKWDAATRRPAVVASVVAADDGTASVPGLRAAGWTLTASMKGWARGEVYASIGDDAATRTATVVLVRGHALTGRVLDADGKPAAGATIFAGSQFWDVVGGDPTVVSTTSGADGAYRLDDLPLDDVALWIAPPRGLAAPWATLDLRTVTTFDIRLASFREPATGTVLDAATGKPITGALVRAEAADGLHASAASAVTDERGRWSIDGLRAPRVERLLIEKSGYVTADLYGDEAQTSAVRLAPAARLVGTVRGPDGPIAGAYVHAGWCGPNDRSDFARLRECSVVTDADGRYVVDRLAPGVVVVEVAADGIFPPWPARNGWVTPEKPEPGPDVVTLSAAGETTLDVAMLRGRVMRAVVVDAACRPVEGARVEAIVAERDAGRLLPGAVAVTGADGTFALPHLPVDRDVTFRAGKEGFCFASDWPRHGQLGRTAFGLGPASRVEGRVRAADGAALHGLRVELLPCCDEFNERWFVSPIELRADADGRFAGFVPWSSFRIRAGADGLAHSISSERFTGASAKPCVVDLTLDAGRAFAGRVIDAASGKPLPGAIVNTSEWHLGDRSGDQHQHPPHPPFMPLRASGERVVAVTDEDGRFRVPGLFRREYDFSFAAHGHEIRRMTWDASDPTQSARDVEIRLDTFASAAAAAAAPRPPASIKGVVRDADGRAVNGVEICAWPTSSVDPEPRSVGRSDDRGVFAVDGLDVGATYRLVARREAVLPTEIRDVAAGTKNVAVAVVRVADGPASTISGRARRADGTLFTNARLRFTHVGDARDVEWTEVGDNPFFRRPFLLPGAYRVDVATYGPDTLVDYVDLGVVATGTKDVVLTATR